MIAQPEVVKAGAVSFSWTDGSTAGGAIAANISTGVCSPTGLRFALPLKAGKATLNLWAGVSGGTLSINASVGGAEIYSEELTAAPSDYLGGILRSNRFEINIPATAAIAAAAAGELVVDIAVSKPFIPPPPPAPPPPPPLKPCDPKAGEGMCMAAPSTCTKATWYAHKRLNPHPSL